MWSILPQQVPGSLLKIDNVFFLYFVDMFLCSLINCKCNKIEMSLYREKERKR